MLLAPTEVLAQQHYRTLRTLAGSIGMHTALLTGSVACVDDRETTKAVTKQAIATGRVLIIIGTHAILQDDVSLPRLALVVIDEQHRFGIQQRASLVAGCTGTKGTVPHLLSMTATPIPRTLALTIFGDLDISILREKPAGRQPIRTVLVGAGARAAMYDDIREQIRQGRQAFVICPVIETVTPTDSGTARQRRFNPLWAQAKAVEDEHKRLSTEVFPDLKVAMLHGRMKPVQKERVMREFKQGWHDILVSTSVIEVGVDVPNATVMLIEGAERFGLAQLHQFRGRVGRAEHESVCYLVPTEEGTASSRLRALVGTDDGFKLAEADMKIRGPGEFFGLKQSGMPDLTMAALADVELIKKARLAARLIMRSDPTLSRTPLLRDQLAHARTLVHAE